MRNRVVDALIKLECEMNEQFVILENPSSDDISTFIYSDVNGKIFCRTYTSFGWRSGKVGGWKIVGGWKSERMENIVVFPLMCLVRGMEKWEDRKLFCLVGEKKGKDGKCKIGRASCRERV